MKTYSLPISSVRSFALTTLFLALLVPLTTSAASTRPTCDLRVTTEEGTIKVNRTEDILLNKGDEINIAWESKNAKTASLNNKKISLSGNATTSPSRDTTYSYRFNSGSARATCTVEVHVVEGTIDDDSLSTESSRPTLEGEVSGTKNVQFSLYKEGSSKAVYTSKVIKPRGGEWKARVSKRLSDGRYDVVLSGEKGLELNTIVRETLAVGKDAQNDERADTTLVVAPIPLLLGGVAKGGGTVSISYVQVINIGKEPATLKGFSVAQNGSASTASVIGLSVTDDSGAFRNTVGGTESSAPFEKNAADVPIEVSFAPGQMRLFTLKAILKKNVVPYLGTQLKIDITGVDVNAAIRNKFPIRGTTWTIGI